MKFSYNFIRFIFINKNVIKITNICLPYKSENTKINRATAKAMMAALTELQI